ncbi:hypothetical protein ACFOYU_11240 [Microvirga sp. GCM10011540]|uniref:hypothetical protein n=1 Tax=Microvirga sp. GCM10011540 TaxID=3317338 RepID=UPI003607D16D
MAKKLHHSTDYRPHRAAAYAPSGDALDAIQKGFRALLDQGIPLPPETVAWVEHCESVKARFKKPPHKG